MADFNPYEAPESRAEIGPKRRDDERPDLWRDGPILVMRDGAEFPDLCVKCGGPAEGRRLLCELRWHPLWYYVLTIIPPLYIIAALIGSEKVKVRVGICSKHEARRRKVIAIGWLLALAGVAAFVGGPYMAGISDSGMTYFGVGAVLFFAGVVVAVNSLNVVAPVQIKKKVARLKGAGPEFLATLPGPS